MPQILVIDDDPGLLTVCRVGLQALGYSVRTAETGNDGLTDAAINRPDVIVLDLGLPDLDGLEVCKRIRTWSEVPIMVLSADSTEDRKVEALDHGADDYMTKPFGMRELHARLQVQLRHQRSEDASGTQAAELEVGPLRLDLARYQATLDGEPLDLAPKELEFLGYLARNAGKVCTRRMILENVWGPGYARELHYLKVYAYRIRRKLHDENGHFLQSDPSVGYRLVPPDLSAGSRVKSLAVHPELQSRPPTRCASAPNWRLSTSRDASVAAPSSARPCDSRPIAWQLANPFLLIAVGQELVVLGDVSCRPLIGRDRAQISSAFEGSVDCGPADAEEFSDLGDVVVAAVVHAADLTVLGGLEAGLLAAELAVLAGDVHALAGPLADQVSLELGDRGQNRQEHLCEWVVPVVDGAAEREPDAADRQLAEDVQCVGHRPGQPVELGHGQGVAVADGRKGLVQTGPGPAGAGEPLVQVDPVLRDSEGGEGMPLSGEVLGHRRASGVADVRHPAASKVRLRARG